MSCWWELGEGVREREGSVWCRVGWSCVMVTRQCNSKRTLESSFALPSSLSPPFFSCRRASCAICVCEPTHRIRFVPRTRRHNHPLRNIARIRPCKAERLRLLAVNNSKDVLLPDEALEGREGVVLNQALKQLKPPAHHARFFRSAAKEGVTGCTCMLVLVLVCVCMCVCVCV